MEDDTTMLSLLKDGKVLYFVFNYRADYEGDDAFLISNGETAFVVPGNIAELEFIGMNDKKKNFLNEEENSKR